MQLGAAVAVTLFPATGVLGTVSLRFTAAAVVLLVLTRPWRVRWTGHDLRTVLAFGLAFVAMNTSLYLAISRLPLATAITLEFLGPLGRRGGHRHRLAAAGLGAPGRGRRRR